MEQLKLDKKKFNKTLPCLRTLGVEAMRLNKSFGILFKNFDGCMEEAHYDIGKCDYSKERIQRRREAKETNKLWNNFERLAKKNPNLSRRKGRGKKGKGKGKKGKKGKGHRD